MTILRGIAACALTLPALLVPDPRPPGTGDLMLLKGPQRELADLRPAIYIESLEEGAIRLSKTYRLRHG